MPYKKDRDVEPEEGNDSSSSSIDAVHMKNDEEQQHKNNRNILIDHKVVVDDVDDDDMVPLVAEKLFDDDDEEEDAAANLILMQNKHRKKTSYCTFCSCCLVLSCLLAFVWWVFYSRGSATPSSSSPNNNPLPSSHVKITDEDVGNHHHPPPPPRTAPPPINTTDMDIHYPGPPLPDIPTSCGGEAYHFNKNDHNNIINNDDSDDATATTTTTLSNIHNTTSSSSSSSRCDEYWMRDTLHTCSCPTIAATPSLETVTRTKQRNWQRAFQRNINSLRPYRQNKSLPLDVLLLGDSITEHWLSTNLGRFSPEYADCFSVYQELFRKPSLTAAAQQQQVLHGLALGIGGDQTVELLYRLRNGESVPVQTQVVWVNIGTNDLSHQCHAEAVTEGVLAVVEELLYQFRERKDKDHNVPTIVINSILPRGGYRETGDLRGNRGWQIARRVNHRLQCFAAQTQGVEFVNATALFVSADNTNLRNMLLYHDDVHPNADGYRVWGNLIVQHVQEIINAQSGGSPVVPSVFPTTASNAPTVTYPGPSLPAIAKVCNVADEQNYEQLLHDIAIQSSDTWCDAYLTGNRPCRCADPTVGAKPQYNTHMMSLWEQAEKQNQMLLEPYQKQMSLRLDLVLLGDSITEHWRGTDLGQIHPDYQEHWQVYQDLFQTGPVRGIALGIGGDRTTQLLYRLRHGESPIPSQTKVLWINIGTNNLADYCNAESIFAGTVAIVEELLQQFESTKNSPTIVINSILPRGGYRGTADLRGDRGWQIARRVNHRLQCYSERRKGVQFIDTTDLFVRHDNVDMRNETLYHDDVHPSAEGYRIWGDFIVRYVQDIINTQAKSSVTTPSASCPPNWNGFLQSTMNAPQEELCVPNMPARNSCKCYKPGVEAAMDRKRGKEQWNYTFYRNLDLIHEMGDTQLDVVLLGDSITEHWVGTDLSSDRKSWSGVTDIYYTLFRSPSSAVSGLALGIAGDRCSNLLYRLSHGELAKNLNPSVWWVLIGTNDITGEFCTSEAIAAGNIAIAQEILQQRPNATIVLNSILPRDKPGQSNMWNTIEWSIAAHANDLLECYAAATHGHVVFFNATDLFGSKKYPNKKNPTLYFDPIHPNAKGYEVWGDAIVEKVQELIASGGFKRRRE